MTGQAACQQTGTRHLYEEKEDYMTTAHMYADNHLLRDCELENHIRRPTDSGNLTVSGRFFKRLRGEGWWARQDSNLQQHGYEPWVLTN